MGAKTQLFFDPKIQSSLRNLSTRSNLLEMTFFDILVYVKLRGVIGTEICRNVTPLSTCFHVRSAYRGIHDSPPFKLITECRHYVCPVTKSGVQNGVRE